MKEIKLNFNGIKDFVARLSKNLSLMFFVIFLFFLVLEIFQIKNSIDIVLNISQPPPGVTTQQGVRINFDVYNKIVQRIQQAPNFVPSGAIAQNPFAVPVPAGQ